MQFGTATHQEREAEGVDLQTESETYRLSPAYRPGMEARLMLTLLTLEHG